MTAGLPLMKSVDTPLAKSVLLISNKKMEDVLKTVKSLE